MDLFLEKLINSIFQIMLFAALPFIYWFITARKKQSFFNWIGLKNITGGRKTRTAIFIVSIFFMIIGTFTLYEIRDVKTSTYDFSGLGLKAIPAIIIYAAFNTSLPEEVLFRGFLLKRLKKLFIFNVANLIQAVLFGVLHGLMFHSLVGYTTMILIILFTGIVAWLMGRINELYSDGSILPSWIIHTLSNVFSGICSAFVIF